VVCDRLAVMDSKPSPSFAFLSLQSFKQMEEGYWRVRILLRRARQLLEDCKKKVRGRRARKFKDLVPARTDHGFGLGRVDVCGIVL
jgi:hypothetical protein